MENPFNNVPHHPMGQGLGRAGRQAGRRSTAVYSASGPGPGQVGLGTTWGRRRPGSRFPDLGLLPPELGVEILSHLNATDLCLASCVWHELATAEPLWQGLCKSNWGYCTIYHRRHSLDFSYRHLYLQLDEGCLTFNADPFESSHWSVTWSLPGAYVQGIGYLFSRGILADNAQEIGRFIFSTETLHWQSLRLFLDRRRDVLDELVKLHNFANQFLPNALRQFFQSIRAPEERGEFLEALITKFSQRFCACNPALTYKLGLSPDSVYVLCYSLILLSVDLNSPHVKNKMSKREFIRNTRQAAMLVSADYVGHLYDNIYLVGHVAA